MTDAPSPFRRWLLAARPRTLPAAMVPVVVGVALIRPRTINWGNSLLCLVVALSLQVGTNYANDYSDGVRGTDAVRVGPFRLTASRLVAAPRVRDAAFASFFVAGAAGLLLASRTSWWLVLVDGATAIAAGWFYTGGPRPYGYYGFGELFVFVYFGMVATVGTVYVQHLSVPSRAWWLGAATGFMACALLEANNLRDVDGDRSSGKKTLAARMSRGRAPWLFALCVLGVFVGIAVAGHVVVAIVAILLYLPALRLGFSNQSGRELLPMLKYSARAQLQLGALLVIVLVFKIGL